MLCSLQAALVWHENDVLYVIDLRSVRLRPSLQNLYELMTGCHGHQPPARVRNEDSKYWRSIGTGSAAISMYFALYTAVHTEHHCART